MKQLLKRIEMPEEAAERVLSTDPLLPKRKLAELCHRLCGRETYEKAYEELAGLLRPDPDGFRMLSVMLRAALVSERLYLAAGIGKDIYTATMKCFSRFVREYHESFGRYGFDRGFWTGRQLSLTLFRLDALEYELTPDEGVVAVHIPTGAPLSDECVDRSLALAEEFFREYSSPVKVFVCNSWMLSPALKSLLKPDSRILHFQERFCIDRVFWEDESYKMWIYKNPGLSPAEFPEGTSLQRAVKKYVSQGGKIGAACGSIKV